MYNLTSQLSISKPPLGTTARPQLVADAGRNVASSTASRGVLAFLAIWFAADACAVALSKRGRAGIMIPPRRFALNGRQDG